MVTLTLASLVPGSVLTNSTATYYTSTNVRASIQNATLTNTTAGAVTATVYLVPPSGSAGASNIKISAQSIAAGATYNCPELIGAVLLSGGTIQALASANTSITFMVSGIEST